MTTTSPAPFPEYDRCKLPPKETMQRAKALACTPKDKMPICSGQIYVDMFFNGAGNNRDKNSVDSPLEVTQYAKTLP